MLIKFLHITDLGLARVLGMGSNQGGGGGGGE